MHARQLLTTLFAAMALAGCGPEPAATPPQEAAPGPGVTGAGASFPAPLYAKWAADYHRATSVRVNYQSMGSAAGLRQVEARTVDFGATDAPLQDEELARQGLVQFPTVIGGVVPVVNLKGIAPGQLRLTGPVLADIYLGTVRRWNDARIAALNPGLPLPDARITPVRRADGSGTTFLFTSYLTQVSPAWRERVGQGTAVDWPTSAGGKGNEGVAAFVGRLPGAIGYVEAVYVRQNAMNYARLQNAAGQFVSPQDEAFRAAAADADWGRSFHQVLVNRPGAQAWPLTGATFILLPRQAARPERAAEVLKFFDWGFREGDATAGKLGYVSLPPALEDAVRKLWDKELRDAAGGPLAWR